MQVRYANLSGGESVRRSASTIAVDQPVNEEWLVTVDGGHQPLVSGDGSDILLAGLVAWDQVPCTLWALFAKVFCRATL